MLVAACAAFAWAAPPMEHDAVSKEEVAVDSTKEETEGEKASKLINLIGFSINLGSLCYNACRVLKNKYNHILELPQGKL